MKNGSTNETLQKNITINHFDANVFFLLHNVSSIVLVLLESDMDELKKNTKNKLNP